MTDLTGQRFNQWTVLGFSHIVGTAYHWNCRCDCGKEKAVNSQSLKSGDSRSCGCHRDRLASARALKHGLTNTPEHATWRSMRSRCTDSKVPNFKDYGGRGISVCERWDSFENFLADMGPRPSNKHSIDRKDNNGNYEPGNCRWATRQEQAENKRSSIMVRLLGREQTVIAWCREFAIKHSSVYGYIKRNKCRPVDAISWALVRAAMNPETKTI